jgi:hypothetical protein
MLLHGHHENRRAVTPTKALVATTLRARSAAARRRPRRSTATAARLALDGLPGCAAAVR